MTSKGYMWNLSGAETYEEPQWHDKCMCMVPRLMKIQEKPQWRDKSVLGGGGEVGERSAHRECFFCISRSIDRA